MHNLAKVKSSPNQLFFFQTDFSTYFTEKSVESHTRLGRNCVGLVHSCRTVLRVNFHFLTNTKRYDREDSLPFDYEPNGCPFGS